MYLTEKRVIELVTEWFPNQFSVNRRIPGVSNCLFKPDLLSEYLGLAIEFDGFRHYSVSSQIKRDKKKDKILEDLGYRTVHIPYFVQSSDNLWNYVFDNRVGRKKIHVERVYDDGFIDKKAMLPADFCELGVERFLEDLSTFQYCKELIINSLKNKVLELKDIDLVIPPSIRYLLN